MATRESQFGPVEEALPGEVDAPWALIGWLEATIVSVGTVDAAEWNKAVQYARKLGARE